MRPAMLRTIPMLLVLTSTLAFPSCGTDTDRADTDASSDTANAGSGSVAAPPAVGQTIVEGCRGETGLDEHCLLVQNASACTAARCDKLVVVFSGGEMGCESGAGHRDVLAGYAAAGYAAI